MSSSLIHRIPSPSTPTAQPTASFNVDDFRPRVRPGPRHEAPAIAGHGAFYLPPPYSARTRPSTSPSEESGDVDAPAPPTLEDVFQRLQTGFNSLATRDEQIAIREEQVAADRVSVERERDAILQEREQVQRERELVDRKHERLERDKKHFALQYKAMAATDEATAAERVKLDALKQGLVESALEICQHIEGPEEEQQPEPKAQDDLDEPQRGHTIIFPLTTEDDTLPGLHTPSTSLTNRENMVPNTAEVLPVHRGPVVPRRGSSANMSVSTRASFRVQDNQGRFNKEAESSGVSLYEDADEGAAFDQGEQGESASSEASVQQAVHGRSKSIRRVSGSNDLRR